MEMLYQSTKKDKSDKTNYRSVSILSNISKIYDKIIYNQLMNAFMMNFFLVNMDFVRDIVLNTVF